MRFIIVVSIMAALLLFTPAPQEDSGQGEATNTIVAYVVADFDEDSNLVAVSLEADEGEVYYVNLDQKGRELGNAFDGEWVEVEGSVMDVEDELWMTVKSISRYLHEEDEEGLFEDESEDWYDPNEPMDEEKDEPEGEGEGELENELEEGDWDAVPEKSDPDKDWPDEADDKALFNDSDFH